MEAVSKLYNFSMKFTIIKIYLEQKVNYRTGGKLSEVADNNQSLIEVKIGNMNQCITASLATIDYRPIKDIFKQIGKVSHDYDGGIKPASDNKFNKFTNIYKYM